MAVPTIYHRSRLPMVGTLPPSLVEYGGQVAGLPYEAAHCELICLTCKLDLDAPVRQINTMDKSILIFRNRVKPENQKYSA